jgi:hypothetical protein
VQQLAILNSNVDTIRAELTTQLEEEKKKVQALQKANLELEQKVLAMEHAHENLEQYSRRNNVILNGIWEIKDEPPADTAIRAARQRGYNIDINQIDGCHWLPRKTAQRGPQRADQTRPFIIKFVSRLAKKDFIIHCKTTRPKGMFANEHLTKRTADLRRYAREKLVPLGYRVDTRDCNVVAWKQGTSKTTIRSTETVDRIIGNNMEVIQHPTTASSVTERDQATSV